MKNASPLILLLVVLIVFVACSRSADDNQDSTATSQTVAETTTERVTSTTSPVTVDKAKSEKLSSAVSNALGNDAGAVTHDAANGSFKYKLNNIDYSTVYSNEASDEYKKKAEKNAQKLVEEIKGFYPDKITLEDSRIVQVGTGDEGIDSAVYVITYVNTQNQELVIRADSCGEIYYVNCIFTW